MVISRLTGGGAAIAIASGATGLAGWLFGIRQLMSLTAETPALMPVSALGIIVAGLALWTSASRPEASRRLGLSVVAIALAAAAGYLLGTSFGFGRILPEDIVRGAATRPGLPAPNSILALALAGVALTTMSRSYVLTHTAALASMVVAYTAGIGELFGASMLQGLSAYTAMSPQTILAIFAIGVGVLSATPGGGVMPLLADRGAAGLLVRRFLPLALILPVVFGALRVVGEAAGVFDTRFGTALMAVASGALASLVTLDTAAAIRRLERGFADEHRARAIAESESRIKDEILSVISDELRAPAGAIHAQAHLLQTGLLHDDRVKEAIATMSRNATLLSRHVDDALDVAAMAQGGLILEAGDVDPREAVRGALDALALDISAKQMVIRLELAPAGFVSGDPVRLQQVARNLLSNAVTFTPGGGEVRVGLRRDGDVVELEIADTGRGIAPDFLPHVFDAFRRELRHSRGEASGLGLGLAIVRHLVELHGGTIAAHSDGIGRGARFTVRLPALGAEAALEKPRQF